VVVLGNCSLQGGHRVEIAQPQRQRRDAGGHGLHLRVGHVGNARGAKSRVRIGDECLGRLRIVEQTDHVVDEVGHARALRVLGCDYRPKADWRGP
jgi:hypothetical protein